MPALLRLALANCSINEPAKVSNLKLPCRASLLSLLRALSYHPARPVLLMRIFLENQKEKDLTFNMDWDLPPPLFKALYGLIRNTQ
jgi:hypothetical protein